VPYILDTDLLSILQGEDQPARRCLEARLRGQPTENICTTIITFQEQMRGRLAHLNNARTDEAILDGYARLQVTLDDFHNLEVLPFDPTAQYRFKELTAQRIRIGTMDLRIASIALAPGHTLLSRNLRHFRKVPGLIVEDWTQ